MSRKCYDVTFKLRTVAAAEGKAQRPLLESLKWTYEESENVVLKR